MKRFVTTILAVLPLLIAGCGKQPVPAPAPVEPSGSVSLSEDHLSAGPEGATIQVQVTSSAEWRVAGYADWVTFSALKGTSGQSLGVTIAENPGAEARTAEFKVFSGNAAQTLYVTSSPAFILDLVGETDTFETSSDAGSMNVTLVSNVKDFDVDLGGASWLSLNRIDQVLGKVKVYFDVDRSQEFKARTSTVTIGGEGVTDPLTVRIVQAQRDTVFALEGDRFIQGLEPMDLTLNLCSNVDFSYSLPSWLSEMESSEKEMDDTGLKTKTVKLHADACGGSRAATVTFSREGSGALGSVYLKQQNPNPIYAVIPDEYLAKALEDAGWILADPTGQCEVLEAGLTSEELTIGSMSGSGKNGLASLEGLEAFPALTRLQIGNATIRKVDLSACTHLTSVKMYNMWNVEEVDFGDIAVEKIDCGYSSRGKCLSSDVVFKGSRVKEVYFSGESSAYFDEESGLNSIDVTGCPALEKLNAVRNCRWGNSSLRMIYMTAAQAETVEVSKLESTEIVIK